MRTGLVAPSMVRTVFRYFQLPFSTAVRILRGPDHRVGLLGLGNDSARDNAFRWGHRHPLRNHRGPLDHLKMYRNVDQLLSEITCDVR